MRVLILSWEYPRSAASCVSQDVAALSAALARAGHDVTVVTRHAVGQPLDELIDGVRVIRADGDPPPARPTDPPLTWTMAVNHRLAKTAEASAPPDGYDVIHAHDWLVTHAAVTLKERLGTAFVATFKATEAGRHQGFLPAEANRSVHSVEWWLGSEACRVMVPSDYLRWEVSTLFDVPADRVDVVPNGIDPAQWTVEPRAVNAARLRFAGEGPLLVYAGRLVAEKGIQDLLAALPKLRDRYPGTRAVVAGDGSHRALLIEQAHRLKLHRAVSFPGRLDRPTLAALFAAADAFVLPSRYEPTGTVALEAAAAGAPLVVASTGGLASIVEHGVTGIRFPVGEPEALADAVGTLLHDRVFARTLGGRAREMVEVRHSWKAIAARTAEVYAAAVTEAPAFEAGRAAAKTSTGGLPVVFVPPGNLLADAPEVPVDARPAGLARAAADEAAWAAGAEAARAAMRAEGLRWAEMARETAPFDVLYAATERR